MFFLVAAVGGGDAVHANMAQHTRRTNSDVLRKAMFERPRSRRPRIKHKHRSSEEPGGPKRMRTQCRDCFFLHFAQAVREDQCV